MSEEMPSEWAIDRALSRFPNPRFVDGASWKTPIMEGSDVLYANSVRFLATQIEKYEQPPEHIAAVQRIMEMIRDMEDDEKIEAELLALTAIREPQHD